MKNIVAIVVMIIVVPLLFVWGVNNLFLAGPLTLDETTFAAGLAFLFSVGMAMAQFIYIAVLTAHQQIEAANQHKMDAFIEKITEDKDNENF